LPDNLKLDPSQWTGTVVNIKKPPRTKEEQKELKKTINVEPYDKFFRRMVDAVGDPNTHLPIE
jgi:hypothetical protein